MGWFSKEKDEPAAPAKKYTFEDFLDGPVELPEDAPRIDVLTREVQVLREQINDQKTRIAWLEANQLADGKALDDWFRNLANATFCDLRDKHMQAVEQAVQQAMETSAKDMFSTDAAHEFAKELGKAIIAAVGKKLGHNSKW